MGLYSFFNKLMLRLLRRKSIPPQHEPIDTTYQYPFLPNYQGLLEDQTYSGESLQSFFIRLGYPYVTWSGEVRPAVGRWVTEAGMDCISSVMRVSNNASRLSLENDQVNALGTDVGFVAFKNQEDFFLFKLRFDFH